MISYYRTGKNAQLYPNSFKLAIHYIQLSAPVLMLLKPALKGKGKLKEIDLWDNKISVEDDIFTRFEDTEECIELVTELIKDSKQMEKFTLGGNHIDTKDAQNLVDAIVAHPSINSVCLEDCFRDTTGYAISLPVTKDLTTSTWKTIV